MSAYEWKIQRLYPVDAQTAGEEFERIYKENGTLKPETIVDESRPDNAPLHNCFEWDDAVAAENYRKSQASKMIRCLVKRDEASNGKAYTQNVYVHVRDDYEPLKNVLVDKVKTSELLAIAKRELASFKAKYSGLKELAEVFSAIDEVIGE